jgi:hypothetical protein
MSFIEIGNRLINTDTIATVTTDRDSNRAFTGKEPELVVTVRYSNGAAEAFRGKDGDEFLAKFRSAVSPGAGHVAPAPSHPATPLKPPLQAK